jgi:hypothetical protein
MSDQKRSETQSHLTALYQILSHLVLMRRIPILITCLAASASTSPALGKAFPLNPIGLPFAPDSPKPLSPGHPLYHEVALDPVADMPNKVGSFLVPITSAREMNEALRQTLERANMLAPPGIQPKTRLVVRWGGLNAPSKVSFSSEATARLSYSLVRIANGEELFRRDISTVSRSTGGDASDRLKGNARLAILTNLASAVLCLDKAAYGQAPVDCALIPGASYHAQRPATVIFLPR